jgi:hypothetical protein
MRGQFNAPKKADHSMSDLSHDLIVQLRSRWKDLHDLDRAREIDTIRRSGVSISQIGRELKISASLLRHLLLCLEASDKDRGLARRGKISTNELARRGQAAKKRRAEPSPEVLEAQRAESARNGAGLICNWIVREGLNGHHGKAIIEGASARLVVAERKHDRPAIPGHAGTPPDILIERYRPNQPPKGMVARISWYIHWLTRWVYFTFEDSIVRDRALKQALAIQRKR